MDPWLIFVKIKVLNVDIIILDQLYHPTDTFFIVYEWEWRILLKEKESFQSGKKIFVVYWKEEIKDNEHFSRPKKQMWPKEWTINGRRRYQKDKKR